MRKSSPKDLENKRKYYRANRERILNYQKEAYKRNPDYNHSIKLKLRYGMTREDYDNLLLKQGNKCAICKQDKKGYTRRMSVDHCHTTGKIRGILCGPCNTLLGLAQDNCEILNNALEYLKYGASDMITD